jgi:subtilase family serine protease
MSPLRLIALSLLVGPWILRPSLYAFQAESTRFHAFGEHVPVWARFLQDVGRVPDAILLEHLSIRVARNPGREQAFQQLLRDQHDPKSTQYHKWLSPQQLGAEYGGDADVLDEVSAWLSSHGLKINSISNDRTVIDFSGTVGALSAAFSSTFHYFDSEGGELISITTEPHISPEIASKIKFIAGLSTVPIRPGGVVVNASPDYTYNCTTGCEHAVSPADFAVIYGLNSVYGSGITGSGQTIAVVGFSRVADSDIESFQQVGGLVVQDPVERIPPDGTDPGPPDQGANPYQKEATLDVERAFGVAPNAEVILDVTTAPQDGVITNLLNIPIADVIDNDLAPILTMSFHSCEADAGMPQVLFADALFQQAAAEGISVFVSAGDSGAADCAAHGGPPPTTATQSINYLCASGYVTCVGGTEFNDTGNPSEYWAPTNTGHLLSALSYIPEGAWNESTQTILISGGGGTSQWIAQPAWQAGTGVPANGSRNVPDVAFTASIHDGYYVCLAEPSGDGDCSQGKWGLYYGTSGATPSMAGIMALVDQSLGERQGNFNPTLYSLAATPSNAVFNDVTVASSGIASCSIDTPSLCNNSITLALGSNPAVLPGFSVNTGYDLVTGWGSINVANLLSALTSQPTPVGSTTLLSVSADTIGTSQSISLTVQVSGNAGTPTGTVQVLSNGVEYAGPFSIDFGQVVLPNLTFPTVGTYNLVAQYSGDSRYAASSSMPVVINSVAPSFQLNASPTSVAISSPGNSATAAITASTTTGYMGALTLKCTVTASNGAQSGNLPTCALSSGGQVSLTASSPLSTLTLTIGTIASSAIVGTPSGETRIRRMFTVTLTMGSLSILLFLLLSNLRSRRIGMYPFALLAVMSLIAWTGCNTHRGGTPSGSYLVSVNATSMSSTVSTQVNVTVN